MKYNIDHIYSISNTLEVTTDNKGSKAMIRENGQDKATPRQGYRVIVDNQVISVGGWNESEKDILLITIKRERYAHLAYKELYYDLVSKLTSIGLEFTGDDCE